MTVDTIPGLIGERAARDPHSVALDDGDEQMTFAEFERRCAAAAQSLRRRGLQPGDIVGVCVERSLSTVVLLLAVLRAGAAYVALDPSHPPARLRWVLQDVEPRFVVVSQDALVPNDLFPLAPFDEIVSTCGEPAMDASNGSPEHPPDDSLAFITYTSGTTGRPKGVMHGHGSACYLIGVIAQYLEIGPGSRFLQFYPLTWETHILEVFAVLASGGTVVVPPVEVDITGPDLVQFLRDTRVTHAMLPPALLAELVERPALPDLATLAYIGEVCRPQVADRWGRGRRFVNLYGPTEVTVVATASDARTPGAAPPIGRPLPGRRVYVLDEQQRAVPDGETGELYVGGRGLALGYWKLPDVTSRAFPPDPFADSPDARMYRTGDLARRQSDGNLDFLGRADEQLSVRGQRVERGEVEAVLACHPAVRASAVVVQGEGSAARLIAFVVAGTDVEAELLALAADELPPVMVPSVVVRLDRLPLNQHGKVDLEALVAHPVPRGDVPAGPLPAGPIEAALIEIFQQVLDRPTVRTIDGFRALGGTSLQAVRVLTLIRDRLGVGLTVPDLLGASDLAGLAALVAAAPDRSKSLLPALRRADVPAIYPASSHQRRLWTVATLRPAAASAYNEVSALALTGPLDVTALRAAVQDLVDRHEALRSTLRLVGADLVVDVAEHAAAELIVEQCSAPDVRASKLGAEPLDLTRAPLLRAVLLRVATAEHVLVLVTHHSVADGLSLDVMDADLASCYGARAAGRAPEPLRSGRLRPRDHAAWHRALADHPAAAAGLEHWRAALDGAPTEAGLVPDRERPRRFSHAGARLQRATGPELRRAIEQVARRAGSTNYGMCLLALAVLLARRTGRRDIVIGSPFAGRPSSDAEEVVGFFTNTVAMRVKLEPDRSALRMLGAVDTSVQDALQHQYVDFDAVTRAVGARPGRSGQPLFQVVLAYQGRLRPNARLTGLQVAARVVDHGLVTADLAFEISEVGDDLTMLLAYSTDIVDGAHAEQLLDDYLGVMAEIAAAPQRSPELGSVAAGVANATNGKQG